MGGLPSIRGLRIPVATVVAMVADGMSTDEIIAELPDLTREDVREALANLPAVAEDLEAGAIVVLTDEWVHPTSPNAGLDEAWQVAELSHS